MWAKGLPDDAGGSRRGRPTRPASSVFLAVVLAAGVLAGCSGGSKPAASTNASTLIGAGTVLYREDNYDAAAQLFEQALHVEPSSALAHYDLGTAYQAENRLEEALLQYQQAVSLDGTMTSAVYNEATLDSTRDPALAVFLYRKVVNQKPDSPTAYLNLGILEHAQGLHTQAGIDLREAIRLEPSLRARIPAADLADLSLPAPERAAVYLDNRRSAMTLEAPKISIFTPSHDTRFLADAYRSLEAQSDSDWEWIVLLNAKAGAWRAPDDPRVKVSRAPAKVKGIGALKRAACELAKGELLLELDHDDLLARGCLAQVVDTFRDPEVVFAYSDWAQINEDGTPNYDRFDETNGWTYSQGTLDGASYNRCHALAATPHNLGYIWYAPNHVRAFRRSTYDEVGGYDAKLEILDDQDLMGRLFLAGRFHHIETCLYFQRIHPSMTQIESRTNALIQEQTVVNYRRTIEKLALAWAQREGLRCLRLRTPIWIGDDPDGNYEEMTVDPADPRLPCDDATVGLIKAYDVLHRIPNRTPFFNDVYRVLTHAGLDTHRNAEHGWARCVSRSRARSPGTTRTASCI